MSLLLSCIFSLVSSSWAQTPTNFPAADVKSIYVSLPKGKVSITSSKTQKDISVVVKGPKANEDKKCIKSVGLENSQVFVKISSENILFEKADCDYDVTIVTPVSKNFDLDLSTSSALIMVKDIVGVYNLKSVTGDMVVNAELVKNVTAKTATGAMNFNFKTCSGRADLDFMSATGKTVLKVPSTCKIRVDYKSAAGKLFNGVGESEDYQVFINAKSASGDFSIQKQ